jgi:uncharacterized Zn finger protein
MQIFEFSVQGSLPEPYTVIIAIEGKSVQATCTCQGALFGSICKHRRGILFDLSLDEMSKEDAQKATEIREQLPGTDVWQAWEHLSLAEREAAKLRKQATALVSKAKKQMAVVMASRDYHPT